MYVKFIAICDAKSCCWIYISRNVSVGYAASIFSILKMEAAVLFEKCVPTHQTALRHLSLNHNFELRLYLGTVN